MVKIVYKKIPKSDELAVKTLINVVLSSLDRKEFFIPYEKWELDSLFD